jgi:hypothetical protein
MEIFDHESRPYLGYANAQITFVALPANADVTVRFRSSVIDATTRVSDPDVVANVIEDPTCNCVVNLVVVPVTAVPADTLTVPAANTLLPEKLLYAAIELPPKIAASF